MDILISSNLERLLYLLEGRDGNAVSRWMEALDKEKVYEVSPKVREGLKDFYGGFCREEDTAETIAELWEKDRLSCGYPHGRRVQSVPRLCF